jgi:hypothetical protein
MDRAFADAIILVALTHGPERVSEVIADAARSLIESGRYSDQEVYTAIQDLLAELHGHGQTRH